MRDFCEEFWFDMPVALEKERKSEVGERGKRRKKMKTKNFFFCFLKLISYSRPSFLPSSSSLLPSFFSSTGGYL